MVIGRTRDLRDEMCATTRECGREMRARQDSNGSGASSGYSRWTNTNNLFGTLETPGSRIEFANASSFHMEYEVIWRNKPKPVGTTRHRGWGGRFALSKRAFGLGVGKDTRKHLSFEDSRELCERLGPNTWNHVNGKLVYNPPEDCKEVLVIAKARIEPSDPPVTVKEKAYSVDGHRWKLTSANSRIVPFFGDEDLERLSCVREARRRIETLVAGDIS